MKTNRIVQLAPDSDGTYPAWAWPGGYPIFYLAADCETICATCANKPEFRTWNEDDLEHLIIASDINWETTDMVCGNCNERIESAYAEDESEIDDDIEALANNTTEGSGE